MPPLPDLIVDGRGDGIGDLFARTIESAKAYAKAEVAVVKAVASSWSRAAVPAIALAIVAIMVAQAALTILLAALGFALATLIGPIGGFLIAAVVGFALTGLLILLAVRRLRRIGS